MSYKVVIAEDFRMIREIFESTVERAEGYTLAASFRRLGVVGRENAGYIREYGFLYTDKTI